MYQPFEYFLGFRYTRSRRKNHFISFISMTSMLGITVGVMALIVVMSVMNGFHKEIRERILGMASHATVTAFEGGLAEWPDAMRLAGEHPKVIGAAPYVEMQVMTVRGESVSGAVIRGIDPSMEAQVSDVGEHMKSGSLETLSAGDYSIVLGSELALKLGVTVGDKVTVVAPTSMVTPVGTMPRLKRFTVSGLFEVGMGEYDSGVGIVHIKDAAKLARLGESVTGVRLKVEDLFEAQQISRELAESLPNLYYVSDWSDHLVAAFNIVSMMVMVVTEKQSDIAILRTLGASSRSILKIFIVQGAAIGVLGVVLGVILGVLLALNVESIVDTFERMFNLQFIDPDLYYISKLPSDLHWDDVVMTAVVAFIITLAATLYPAFRASGIQPAEALRYE
ncbi:ABC transporter permease [Solemya velum gill symbiont]|uniref:ABC transporter permease n=1 Tax=Solemya velum gill symbiont TaxID=2340 RepID=UPI0009979F67|nr:ABC transporter permease [Solemya velum gill symbiont]OOZ33946.1 ABC transporter permease [Solemya velum gill symbiont]